MAVLMWITHSRRPLPVDEICCAITIQIGANNLGSNDISAISTFLGPSQGLAIVDKGTSTIRLIHSTLQIYLCTHPDLCDSSFNDGGNLHDAYQLSAHQGSFGRPIPRPPEHTLNILLYTGDPYTNRALRSRKKVSASAS